MKHDTPTRRITGATLVVIVAAIVMLTCGGVGFYASRVLHDAYAHGTLSVGHVREHFERPSATGTAVSREAILFSGLARMNRECQSMADLFAKCSGILVVWGVVLLAISIGQLRHITTLKREIAEQAARPLSSKAADDL